MSISFAYEPGDHLVYPAMDYTSDGDDSDLVVIDRKIDYYPKSRKYHISYLYDNMVENLVEEMKENIRNELDNVVVIWGNEGVGKSHLAYYLAKRLNPNFDMNRHYIYEFDTFLSRITDDLESAPGTVYWLDEATNIASNRDWMHTENKEFIKILEMFRSRGWTLILCIPKLDRLDLYIRETRCRYVLQAVVMAWDIKYRELKRGFFKLTRTDFSRNLRTTRDLGYGHYDPIPEPDLSLYQKLKLQSQTNKLQELNEMKEAKKNGGRLGDLGRRNRALMLALSDDGYSDQRIADITGMAVGSVSTALSKARKER